VRHNPILLGLLLALMVLQAIWYGVITPPQSLPLATVLTLLIAPLAVVTAWQAWRPGLGAVYAGLLLLLYFCKGVMEAYSTPLVRVPAIVEICLIGAFYVVLFFRVLHDKRVKRTAAV